MSLLLALLVSLAPEFQTIRILATSDLHARVAPSSDFEAPGIPRRQLGGLANLAAHIARIRTSCCLLLDCGDFLYGSPEGDSTHGRIAIDFMNGAGYDAATLGATDFAGGAQQLEYLAGEAHFPMLATPMLDVVLRRQVQLFRPYLIRQFDDLRIAVVGLTDPAIPTRNTLSNTLGLPVNPPDVQLAACLSALKAESADIIVVIGHVNPDGAAELLAKFEELDLAICPAVVLSDQAAVQHGRLVTVGAYGQRLAQIDLLTHIGRREVDAVSVRQLNVLPVGQEGVVWRSMNAGADSAIVVASHELANTEADLVSLGATIAWAVQEQTKAEMVILPLETIEPGLPEGPLSTRDIFRVAPFEERLRQCVMSDSALHQLLSGADPGQLAPVLAGGDYFVLGDTCRWPLASQVARIRPAGRPPHRIVTTEALLEKAGFPGEGTSIASTLTEAWLRWVERQEYIETRPRPRLYVASPGVVPRNQSEELLEPVNINTATAELLERLPGVGPMTAQRIVEYRRVHGRFATVEELRNVKGIGPKKLEQIRALVTTR